MRIKTFTGTDNNDLDHLVNSWIEKNQDKIKVKNIQLSVDEKYNNILVVYEYIV